MDNGKNGKNDDLQINNNKINNNARKFTNSKKDNSEFKTSANQILNTSQNMNTTQNSLMNPNLSPFDINYNYHGRVHYMSPDEHFEDIKRAIIKTMQAGKNNLKYTDAVLTNSKTREKADDTNNEEIKAILDSVYVKK